MAMVFKVQHDPFLAIPFVRDFPSQLGGEVLGTSGGHRHLTNQEVYVGIDGIEQWTFVNSLAYRMTKYPGIV